MPSAMVPALVAPMAKTRLACLQDLPEKLRKAATAAWGPNTPIHMADSCVRIRSDDLAPARPCSRTGRSSAAGWRRLGMGQCAQIAEHALLRVLPDGAGVEDDHDPRPLRWSVMAIAAGFQHPADAFGVGLVLLAAVGIDKGDGRDALGLPVVPDLLANLFLPAQRRRGDNGGLMFQGVLLRDGKDYDSYYSTIFCAHLQAQPPKTAAICSTRARVKKDF